MRTLPFSLPLDGHWYSLNVSSDEKGRARVMSGCGWLSTLKRSWLGGALDAPVSGSHSSGRDLFIGFGNGKKEASKEGTDF